MHIDYFQLPFGSQLLIWTSRVYFHGSCRTKPNKYDIIDLAFEKVGIFNGSKLLKPLLSLLKNKENFHMQLLHARNLNNSEIDFINCVDYFKYKEIDNYKYIKLWNLGKEGALFSIYMKRLSLAFKKVNLATCLIKYYNNKNFENLPKNKISIKIVSKMLH